MRIALLGVGAVVLGACSGSATMSGSPTGTSAAGALSACSPLTANVQPLTLGNILGAGRHADGTVYVLDDGEPAPRAFVSQGNVLQRSMPSDAARLMSTPTASQPLTVLANASPGADLTFFCR